MYLARFSYDVLPVNRDRALDFIRREAAAARANGLQARVLVPLTRGPGQAALQFEVELPSLDGLETFRQHAGGPVRDAGDFMHSFSEILLSPPAVEILRIDAEGG